MNMMMFMMMLMMIMMMMMMMIIITGLPEPPDDCRVTNETNDSLSVTCRYPYYHDILDNNPDGDDIIKLVMKVHNTKYTCVIPSC